MDRRSRHRLNLPQTVGRRACRIRQGAPEASPLTAWEHLNLQGAPAPTTPAASSLRPVQLLLTSGASARISVAVRFGVWNLVPTGPRTPQATPNPQQKTSPSLMRLGRVALVFQMGECARVGRDGIRNSRSSASQLSPRDHDPEMSGDLEVGSQARDQRLAPEIGTGSRPPGEARTEAIT